MHFVLGMTLRNNVVEVFDDDTHGKEPYSSGGLAMAITEGNRRMEQNPDIEEINVYQVYDGVKRSSPQGRYQSAYRLSREWRAE